ncbi:outer membrane lipoprotein-sorting protein [Chitinophaga polysaccharea]|uniref:outer membrane lipoprotein-sorting protein n=1 Tax=Chitinophaga polysaccharea TaxID=1293035 RepID=UPI0014553423|nr:outer membrane lipoprotein-sorting protein [Chitinophaga polysaccharea]NLR61960.1 outer membrane lipoprotein-sorting protein [Chitinophaga polysaccharea]
MTRIKSYALLAAFLITGISTYAQTADEIIAKNTAAMGGEAKLKDLKTQYVEGNMEVQGQSVPIKKWVKQNEGMRLEFNVMGSNNVQVVTRSTGWSLMPVMMQTAPQDMDSATLKIMQAQLDLRGELYDYKNKGKKIALAGKEDVNGTPAYKLKVTGENGATGDVYIDANTFLIVKTVNNINIKGQSLELVLMMSDYKKTPEGYAYAATTTQTPGDVKINVSKVDVNTPVVDTLFAKPQ